MRYADFVRTVAAAAGVRQPRLVAVPGWLLRLGAVATRLPFVPTVRAAEIRRLMEDKGFDVAPMRRRLGIEPADLRHGLGATFDGRGPVMGVPSET
jgi:hypothetical protein